MTPELRDYFVAVTANIRQLAFVVERLAELTGYDQTADDAYRIAEDVLDAYNQLEGM